MSLTDTSSAVEPAEGRSTDARDPIHATTLGDMVVGFARRWPAKPAIIFPDEQLSSSELLARAIAVARSLRALGIERGDAVGILMPNCIEYIDVLFGAALLGATVVTINARFRSTELEYVLADSEIKVLATSDAIVDRVDFVELVRAAIPGSMASTDSRALALDGAPALRACVVYGAKRTVPGFMQEREFAELATRVPETEVHDAAASVRIRDPALLIYTSGTTAKPKGCLLSHEALVRTASAQAARFEMTPDDAFWTPLPLFHMAAMLPLLNCMWAGAAFVTALDFEPGAALGLIESSGATLLYPTFPTIVQAMMAHPDFQTFDLRRVRLFNHVAPPDLQRQVQKAFGPAVQVQSYGSTELSGVVAVTDPSDPPEVRATTCGRPWRGMDLRIVDLESGADAPMGAPGEIVVRGFGMLSGYHNDPLRTKEAIDDAGWFHTGDIGSIDADGRIRFHGRDKDMFKVGGENVAALEVESYLCTHPAIKLAQVVGVPDQRLVEVVAAFIELHPDHILSTDDVVDHCRGKIASFKIPRHVRFVDAWPMSATKIQKYVLRDRIITELSGEAIDASVQQRTA